ncbi:hypothetical protein [Paenibacillus tepidiphilus]|uniref:hypothetical protein n=1 Tax=Paenibacillus tepidiphilus TaxID=2608683 RepID=UPI00123AF15E|nr:hypothetical protein [Paenibacillus tepidiphilus]
MSYYPATYHEQVLYQADAQSANYIKNIRHQMQQICHKYKNQYVKIETVDSQVVIGRIVGCEKGLLKLAVRPPHGGGRGLFGSPSWGQDEMILTLVLYELLVITLLYT